jgi:hypothetical protein
MKWLAVVCALLFVMPALAQTSGTSPGAPATAMTPTPDERAKQWLSLIDDGNYGEAWKQAGASLQSRQNQAAFAGKLGGQRGPMGAMSSRTLKDVQLTKTVPGMRNGQYAVVRYDSAFAHQAAAIESVTLAFDHGGWSVIDYRILS